MNQRTPNTTGNRFGKALRCAIVLLFAGLYMNATLALAQSPTWILIDTNTLTLTVHSSHNRLLASFHNVSIGSGGAATMRHVGDSTTPLGTFHVAWVNHRSPFGIFFGLDFPTASYGGRAYLLGLINKEDYDAILDASLSGNVPPQDTPLGGRIGIHGLGRGDPDVQRNINWTDGCIALANADMNRLAKWIRLGTLVVIQ